MKVGVQEACGTEVLQRVPETEPLMGAFGGESPPTLSSVSVLLLHGAENFVRTVHSFAHSGKKEQPQGLRLQEFYSCILRKKDPILSRKYWDRRDLS